jgi:S-adenosylmethionine decarboxylase
MTVPFAPGTHLLIDFWGASRLDDIDFIEHALSKAAIACGATVLAIHLHSFGENAGVTGVAMLAESHISLHSWPEIDYVALDVFMCGSSNPHLAIPVLRDFFKPGQVSITEAARGRVMSSELISR